MKKTLYLLIGCMISVLASAQPVVKGYIWKEQSARGAKPTAIAGEAGNVPARKSSGGMLYIYLEFKPAQNILPYRIWIDGKPYKVVTNLQQQLPVIRQTAAIGGSGFNNDTLVPATANQVMKISPVAELTKLTIPTSEAAKLSGANGTIVVEYYWKARRYAFTFPEIKMLPPVTLQ